MLICRSVIITYHLTTYKCTVSPQTYTSSLHDALPIFVNQGLLEATAAGGLVLSVGQFNNNGGTIEAIGSGNNVFLEFGVSLSGGTFEHRWVGLLVCRIVRAASIDCNDL